MTPKKAINVEVKGISFDNQGACLMLFAIIEEFERRGVFAHFVIEYSGTSIKHFPHRLWRKTRYIRKGKNLLALLDILPSKLLALFNHKPCRSIDMVLDASGFSYGDQWNWKVSRDRLGSSIKELKANNVPVVLLPQALGPFKNSHCREQFEVIARHADLIFARDNQSFAALTTFNKPEISFLAPDFTPTVTGLTVNNIETYKNRACIIPNSKMMTKSEHGATNYLTFLKLAITESAALGLKPFILLHELNDDERLVNAIRQDLTIELDVIAPKDVRYAKTIIGNSKLLISSRFHGVVSGLSQAIPTLCTGWSHKYEALMAYYDSIDYLIEPTDRAKLRKLLRQLNDTTLYDAEKAKLELRAQHHLQSIPTMWDKVFKLI